MVATAQEPGKVKAEQKNVKAEQRVGVKTEQRVGVKAEQLVNVKAERGAAASCTSQQKLPPLDVKLEQLRKLGTAKIKSELLRLPKEQQSSSSIAKLVARGLQMRAEDQHVKGEKGVSSKKNKGVKLIKVKKERSRNADGRLRKKPRVTAKRRNSSREVMNREVALSEELGELLGSSALSRPEAVRQLWAHCRDNDMLNPENRREIQFTPKLEKMMGTPTASMFQLTSLLVPHFDYTQPVVKQELKQEPGRTMKLEAKKEQHIKTMKVEAKKEQHNTVKQETKQEPGASAKRMKHEPATNTEDTDKEIAKVALATAVLHISSFDATTAVVECPAPPGHFQLKAVAKSTSGPAMGKPELEAPCAVEFREDRNGVLVPRAEARLAGLDAKSAYHMSIRICNGEGCTHEVVLPQRACPAQWSPRDVAIWCQAQHVPELVRMAQDYGIDGKTLLSMGEEDLKASGLAAPFLLRRILAGLRALRAGGS